MPIVPDQDALRRPLRSCAIGALVLFVFLAAWQLLIPDGESNPFTTWAFLIAGAAVLSSGVGLAVSATRRLWRSTQRGLSLLPAGFLIGAVVAFPSAASAAGANGSIGLASVLLALLASAVFSAYLIINAREAAPAPSPPVNFNADEPDAYASDIPRDRKAH